MSAIPLVDLGAAHAQVADEIREGMDRLMQRTAFVLGDEVAAFETEYASFVGAKHCIGVSNGTDALELGLRAAGVAAGDEVIVPANSFFASAASVVRAGAAPVFVDCDPEHLSMDPRGIEKRITPRTRAIMPVHLFGQVAAMEPILEIARSAGVSVVEDAAQAQGATQNGVAAGSYGIAAGTSFYPGKNLGAYGDAGAVTTNDDEIAGAVRALRNYGSLVKYHHPAIGFNCRLDAIQAVVLRAKLKRLARWNEMRREAAERYDQMLDGQEGVKPVGTREGNEHIYHLYVVRVARRDEVLAQLNERGIGAGIHYPTPLHLEGAFRGLGYRKGDFPVAEAAAGEILSLPLFPEITESQQGRVVEELQRSLS